MFKGDGGKQKASLDHFSISVDERKRTSPHAHAWRFRIELGLRQSASLLTAAEKVTPNASLAAHGAAPQQKGEPEGIAGKLECSMTGHTGVRATTPVRV
jgi:hypothetical protein